MRHRTIRRFRFRLRTLCIFVVLASVLMAYIAHLRASAQRHFTAASQITKAGHSITYGYEFDEIGNPRFEVEPPIPQWLAKNIGVRPYGGTRVYFGGGAVSDEQFLIIGDLQYVTHIVLSEAFVSNSVSDDGLSVLRQHPYVVELDLCSADVGDKGLAEIGQLSDLQVLGLGGTHITDNGLQELKGLKHLQTLGLSGTVVSDEGMRHIARINSLRILDISYTDITDKGLAALHDLRNLEFVNARSTHATKEGVRLLKQGGVSVEYHAAAELSH